MADEGIFCNQADMLRKAGANVNSNLNAANDTTFTYSNDFISQAESIINARTRKNWSDVYSTLNSDIKQILKQVASDIAATYCINYDMSGYTSRAEAETMLDVLNNSINRGLQLLKDKKVETFMEEA
jgi:hypothetical protein